MTRIDHGADSSSSSSGLFHLGNRPEFGPEDRLLRVLSDSSRAANAGAAQLEGSLAAIKFHLEDAGATWAGQRIQAIERVQSILDAIHDLPNRDYRALVGALNLGRAEESMDLLPLLKQVRDEGCGKAACTILDHLHALRLTSHCYPELKRMPLPEFDRQFATDALMLLRTAYPLGVNMKSPEWEQLRDLEHYDNPVFYDARHPMALRRVAPGSDGPDSVVVKDQVILRPVEDMILVRYYPPGREPGRSRGIRLGAIQEGESMVIGRSLQIADHFGLRHPDRCPLCTIHAAPGIDQSEYSRAGMRLVLLGGGLYVFDSGARNTFDMVGCDELGPVEVRYASDTMCNMDGTLCFGRSRIMRRPPSNDDSKT